LGSLLFYFWGETWLTLVMLTSTTIDYISGRVIGSSDRPFTRRLFLVISVVANLTILAVFKYANFGLENFAQLMASLGFDGWQDRTFAKIALPLGISFYTFQSMSYTIDVYRGQVKPTRDFLGFATFVTMFPQLVAGPIVRYRDVAEQITGRVLTTNLFSSGVQRFIVGLGKKVLIANTIAAAVDRIFVIPEAEMTVGLAWLGVILYPLQLYFDFSGYSDMAIGLGRMLGFRFPENFNYPYVGVSLQDFWRRWHISLSTWFRDYLFIPLGGSRGSNLRVAANLVVVFGLCGFWHGAAWFYVIFGLYHGIFLGLERGPMGRWLEGPGRPVGHLYMHLVLTGGWVIFRNESMAKAGPYALTMLGLGDGEPGRLTAAGLLDAELMAAALWGVIFCLPVLPWLLGQKNNLLGRLPSVQVRVFGLVYGGGKVAFLLAILVMSTLSLASGSYNPFIYYRF